LTKAEAVEWLRDWLIREFNLQPEAIDNDRSMISYGLSSIHSVMLVGDLEDELQISFPPTLIWDYVTVNAMAEYLSVNISETRKLAIEDKA
jgi:phthiocerol/phenolphthiocerol synthesis type-I polyketide synthase C